MHFWQEHHRRNIVPFSVHHIRGACWYVYHWWCWIPWITDDCQVSSLKVMIFSFIVNEYHGGILLDDANILFPFKLLPSDFGIHQCIMPATIITAKMSAFDFEKTTCHLWFCQKVALHCWNWICWQFWFKVKEFFFSTNGAYIFAFNYICLKVTKWRPFLEFFCNNFLPKFVTSP